MVRGANMTAAQCTDASPANAPAQKLTRTSFGGHVVCEDAQLIVEEAPTAYKNVERVLEDLALHRLATPIAAFQPVVTFKKTHKTGRGER